MSGGEASPWREIAPAKLNLALHVRSKRPDGRHAIETIFAFCTDGDRLTASASTGLTLSLSGPFSTDLGDNEDNLVLRAARTLRDAAGTDAGAELHLVKALPVASGIGGGSADAAAALRILTAMWRIDPAVATAVAPSIGSDVPACLLSLPARGEGAGDEIRLIDGQGFSGRPVLLVNPRIALSTAAVFAAWDGMDRGPLEDWRSGRNDLEQPARALVPQIGTVLDWLSAQKGAGLARMSGSGATCFALFEREDDRDRAAEAVPHEWWHLSTYLR